MTADMATSQHSVPGISSRRSACDKCRFSKARCLRKHRDQAQCDRCSRTDSECVTSPVFRLRSWQPPAANSDTAIHVPQSKDIANKRKRCKIQLPQMPKASQSVLDLDLDLLGAGGDHSLVNVADLYQDLGCFDPSTPPTITLPSFGDEREAERDTTFDFMDCSLELDSSMEFLATIPPATSRPETTVALPSLTPSSTVSAFEAVTLSSPDRSPWALDDTLESDDATPEPPKCTPLQTLSKLDYELLAILGQISQEPSERLEPLTGVEQDSAFPLAVDSILNKTTEFLNILKILTESSSPSTSPAFKTHESKHGSGSIRQDSFSSSSSDYGSSLDSPTVYLELPGKTPSSVSIPTICQELDTLSLLPILLVYTRLLRLYLCIFTHVYIYLKKLSESENPHLRPISGFSLSSLHIQSGNLQILIFIQVVVNNFEIMDALLGLPEEFKITRRRGEKHGLLNVPGFSAITRSVLMKEVDRNSRNGKGGMKALRKHIAKVKQLLRERIAP